MNCMQYALKYWEKNPDCIILYNSDHVINVPARTVVKGFLPLALFGDEHLIQSFKLTKNYRRLLALYLDYVS